MKLMILNNVSSSNNKLIKFLAQQTGLEVISITEDNLTSLNNKGLSNEEKLKEFNSIIFSMGNEASIRRSWANIDSLPHVPDSNLNGSDKVDWASIDKIPYNKFVDEKM